MPTTDNLFKFMAVRPAQRISPENLSSHFIRYAEDGSQPPLHAHLRSALVDDTDPLAATSRPSSADARGLDSSDPAARPGGERDPATTAYSAGQCRSHCSRAGMAIASVHREPPRTLARRAS